LTDIILQRGQCAYWGCGAWTQGIYCRDHAPTRCRVCNCEPYGSRGLTYGMCIRHYKYWARHNSPQRERILAQDRKRSRKRTEQRRQARRAAREAGKVVSLPWVPRDEAERLEIGGWASGACLPPTPPLHLVRST
jgi:hypothetical protein